MKHIVMIFIAVYMCVQPTPHRLVSGEIGQVQQIPTIARLEKFLYTDKTNLQTYDEEHTCVWFTQTFIDHAAKAGIKAYPVYADWNYEPFAHAFVAVLTSDAGLLFIEPQDDGFYQSPHGGQPLCEINGGCWYNGEPLRIIYIEH